MKKLLVILCFLPILGSAQTDDIRIPNVFTPNGDQVNDNFFVESSYESQVVQIFNRHGQMVYRYEGRNGNWDGRTHTGMELPEGIYFVTVSAFNSDGTKEQADGWVTLIR